MKIVALDPGPVETSMVVWDGSRVLRSEHSPNYQIKKSIRNMTGADYDFMVCEMIASYGMSVGKEVFETCVWIGRFRESVDFGFRLAYRKDIKMHLCGSMRAKDGNIRQALIDKHGVVGTKKNPGPLFGISKHKWAALAVADYAFENVEALRSI